MLKEILEEVKECVVSEGFDAKNSLYTIANDLTNIKSELVDKKLLSIFKDEGIDVKKEYLDAIGKMVDSLEELARSN